LCKPIPGTYNIDRYLTMQLIIIVISNEQYKCESCTTAEHSWSILKSHGSQIFHQLLSLISVVSSLILLKGRIHKKNVTENVFLNELYENSNHRI